ncbi:unnamed protein product [Tetraodon nigroviridis]|uniref:Chromosome undetermined SCAF9918, whole genome shotgun sequence n=1 Tax=Tetraodon nigroviridis TaxID=99883 RepID=Q4T3V3_TETNG|nr:unnamed protein product [Tetraodon nigroviridis]
MTNPPVQLQRNMEVSLPQSYCAFDFSALPQHLQDTFHKVPLEVEVWHKDTNSRDQLIGKATIQLSHLLVSERRRFHTSTGQQGWRQTHQDKIPVLKPQHPTEKVAELSFVATLEDLGFVKTKEVIVSESLQLPSNPAAHRPLASTVAPKAPILQRDTPEYRTALELERWKEEQEDLFEKRKELSYMQALAGEVKKRDQEREAIFRKKEMEYKAFEEQLQTTLLDLKKREEQLAEAELEAEHELAQKELRAERELMERELQESRRRLQQECEHRVALERERVQLMEEERTRLLQQIADGKSRHKQLEKEFQQYREQQNIKPEFRLQSEVNVLTLEKVGREGTGNLLHHRFSTLTLIILYHYCCCSSTLHKITVSHLILAVIICLIIFLSSAIRMFYILPRYSGGAGEEAGVHHQVQAALQTAVGTCPEGAGPVQTGTLHLSHDSCLCYNKKTSCRFMRVKVICGYAVSYSTA